MVLKSRMKHGSANSSTHDPPDQVTVTKNAAREDRVTVTEIRTQTDKESPNAYPHCGGLLGEFRKGHRPCLACGASVKAH